jgi:rod shape-determining protein MreC
MATSETLKGAEAAEQQKTSEGMAEKLPGLLDPNLPADQQPLNDTSNPNPVSKPPMAIHPDRFTPGNSITPKVSTTMESGQAAPGAGVSTTTTSPKKKQAPPKPAASEPDSNPASAPTPTPQGDKQ